MLLSISRCGRDGRSVRGMILVISAGIDFDSQLSTPSRIDFWY